MKRKGTSTWINEVAIEWLKRRSASKKLRGLVSRKLHAVVHRFIDPTTVPPFGLSYPFGHRPALERCIEAMEKRFAV